MESKILFRYKRKKSMGLIIAIIAAATIAILTGSYIIAESQAYNISYDRGGVIGDDDILNTRKLKNMNNSYIYQIIDSIYQPLADKYINAQDIDYILAKSNINNEIEANSEGDNNTSDAFSHLVAESKAVEDSYFDDAVFIGNSRTEGFILSNSLTNVNNLTFKGLMVDTVFTKQVIKKNGKRLTVAEALQQCSFDKVYIMLGINELGWVYSNKYIEDYEKIIDYIRQIKSNAIIYVQSILPVTQDKSENDSIYNNENIDKYNKLLETMCAEKEVYFINVNEEIQDANGCLPQTATSDGVHLNREYCINWYNYLKTHTIIKNTSIAKQR